MFCIRQEGQKIQQGINFYPLKDPSSFGALIRFKDTLLRFRYSKHISKWFIGRYTL